MNIEEEIINKAGYAMAREIDFGVLTEMLCGIGWTRVILKPMTGEQGRDVDEWVANNIKGHFETMGLVWVFEQPKDAVWFTLRWMS
jgi:hypothetical protein